MSAADQLVGLNLPNGWRVTRHLARHPNGTGGTFSQSYEVKNGDRIGFLKAFDFAPAFEPGVDTVSAIQILVDAYNHERDVLSHCRERRLSNVVLAIDNGSVQVPGLPTMEGRVFYMIFEMADGDVRVQMDVRTRFDMLWCMRALKDVCLALHQVHREMIAHQDAKPSNVLTYGKNACKLADFGRSSRRGHNVRHDNYNVAGDRSYAPPELLYGFLHTDFIPRRIGCDLYMLGNLAAFLFSGVNVTAHLLSSLDPQHHPKNWGGTYEEVLPYLESAFTSVLGDIGPLVDSIVRDEVVAIIRELCEPDLSRRGHSKGMGRPGQFSLERYVSQLDLTARRLSIRLNTNRKTAA
jgi:eukaryotic-like serine/threonine-protein kinase